MFFTKKYKERIRQLERQIESLRDEIPYSWEVKEDAKEGAKEYCGQEEFIDEIIKRIKRKQL